MWHEESCVSIAGVPGPAPGHLGILSQRQFLLDAMHPQLEPPERPIGKRHQQMMSAALGEYVVLPTWPRAPHRHVPPHHPAPSALSIFGEGKIGAQERTP
jgi:hypothetical protein